MHFQDGARQDPLWRETGTLLNAMVRRMESTRQATKTACEHSSISWPVSLSPHKQIHLVHGKLNSRGSWRPCKPHSSPRSCREQRKVQGPRTVGSAPMAAGDAASQTRVLACPGAAKWGLQGRTQQIQAPIQSRKKGKEPKSSLRPASKTISCPVLYPDEPEFDQPQRGRLMPPRRAEHE